MKAIHMGMALMVVTIWGINFSVIKLGLGDFPPILFSALRFAVVAIPACFIVPFPKVPIRYVLGVGISLGIIKFALLFVGMDLGASPGLSSLLLQMQVIFTILLSTLLFKEKLNRFQCIGIGLSAVGFVLIATQSSGDMTSIGFILIIMAAAAWAVSNLFMKKMPQTNMFHFMVWISIIPPLPLLGLSYFMESKEIWETLSQVSTTGVLALGYTAFLSTLLTFAIWGYLLRIYPAATVTPFALFIPIAGMICAAIVFDEAFEPMEQLATVFIMSGLIFCVLGPRLFGQGQKKRAEQRKLGLENG